MGAFLEYIMLNYTWFLGGLIIILLAIIGYYADETNFGQGKNKEQSKDKDELNKIENKEELESSIDELQLEETIENEIVEDQIEPVVDESKVQTEEESKIEENLNTQEVLKTNFEEEFEKFDKEFNEVLPQKEILNDGLLEEIENLSLDKTQKIDLIDIPDLDDVELPKIKSLEPEEKDIWKF